MDVHAAARLAVERLGHEGRDHPGLLGDRLEGVAEGDEVVGSLERRRGVDVDLVLAPRNFVMRGVDGDPHAHQRADHALADVAVAVAREVEVRATVVADGDERSVGGLLEQEELHLRADSIFKAETLRVLHCAPEHAAGIALVRLAVRGRRPADQARGGLVTPGQQLERRRVRDEIHVRLGRPGEGVDRRAVEPGPMGNRLGKLGRRDRNRLHPTDHIGELEVDMADVRFLHTGQKVGGRFPLGGRWQWMASNWSDWAERTSAGCSADTIAPCRFLRPRNCVRSSCAAHRQRHRRPQAS